MKVARRTPGPAYANPQWRKPREEWRGVGVRRYGDYFGAGSSKQRQFSIFEGQIRC
jgi:hypothetical protein